jgi:hypothetical protein
MTYKMVYEIRVEPKSEDVFNDDFWESLDFVVNALDNNQGHCGGGHDGP